MESAGGHLTVEGIGIQRGAPLTPDGTSISVCT